MENNVTNARKRAFCWGIAIHSLADAFAHSTCYTNGKAIIHGNNDAADNIEIARSRHTAAKEAVAKALSKFTMQNRPDGTYDEFSPAKKALSSKKEDERYKMINIYENIKAVAGENIANGYSKVSRKRTA